MRRDRLIGITRRNGGNQITDSETIGSYDNNGNPGNYMGNVLEWTRGRMLSSCGSITYKYDANGIRTQKTVNGTTHKYYMEDGTLHYETRTKGSSTQKLWYYYDGNGICGIEYNGTAYYFQKNLQGDVTRIFDRNGSLVAQYVYDAWGNHKVLDMSGAENTVETFIGNVNPIRYRGYYYDEESGLYYLQSRYYDSDVGRFFNADEVSYIEPETLMGCNLYAYCGNNPVSRIDTHGTSWNDFVNWLKRTCNGVKNFFTRDIPNFFTKKIPDWWNNDVVPFFTRDIPNFFTKTIPDFFVNTFWNDWIVDKVWNQFIVGTIWEQGLLVAWNWLVNTKAGTIVWNSIWVAVSLIGLGASIVALVPPVTPAGVVGVIASGASLFGSVISLLMAIFS